jgi:hypothetical protein
MGVSYSVKGDTLVADKPRGMDRQAGQNPRWGPCARRQAHVGAHACGIRATAQAGTRGSVPLQLFRRVAAAGTCGEVTVGAVLSSWSAIRKLARNGAGKQPDKQHCRYNSRAPTRVSNFVAAFAVRGGPTSPLHPSQRHDGPKHPRPDRPGNAVVGVKKVETRGACPRHVGRDSFFELQCCQDRWPKRSTVLEIVHACEWPLASPRQPGPDLGIRNSRNQTQDTGWRSVDVEPDRRILAQRFEPHLCPGQRARYFRPQTRE